MSNKYNKLVRDKIPDIILNNGEIPIISVLTEEEYISELFKKLDEEYSEILISKNKEELLEKSANMLEVIISILELNGYTLDDLIRERYNKEIKRGGFSKRLYLSGVKPKRETSF